MSEQTPLSAEEREAFAREWVNDRLDVTPAVESPVAIFTAGQPGSGKGTVIVNSVTAKFEDAGTPAIKIDPDEIRLDLPYMRERVAQGDLDIPPAAYSDAGTIAARAMELAAEGRRNIVYDGTLSNSFYAEKSIDHLKAREYRVEVHGMAVAPDLSHASTYDRREGEIMTSKDKFGRGVGDEFHDQAVSGLVDTIERLQAQGKVDAIVLRDRHGVVASTNYEQGRWVPEENMADTLRRVHAEPDRRSLEEAAETWDRAAAAMRDRGADPADQRKVDQFRDRAAERLLERPRDISDRLQPLMEGADGQSASPTSSRADEVPSQTQERAPEQTTGMSDRLQSLMEAANRQSASLTSSGADEVLRQMQEHDRQQPERDRSLERDLPGR